MIKWLADRKFNMVDMWTNGACGVALGIGAYWQAAVFFVGGIIISLYIESEATPGGRAGT